MGVCDEVVRYLHAEALVLEVWHKVTSGLLEEDICFTGAAVDRRVAEGAVGALDVMIGSVAIPLRQLLTCAGGVQGWHVLTGPTGKPAGAVCASCHFSHTTTPTLSPSTLGVGCLSCGTSEGCGGSEDASQLELQVVMEEVGIDGDWFDLASIPEEKTRLDLCYSIADVEQPRSCSRLLGRANCNGRVTVDH